MSTIFNPNQGSGYITQTQLDTALSKKITKNPDNSLSIGALTATSATLSSTLAVPTIAGASAGVLHTAGTTGNVTSSLISTSDISDLAVTDGKLASAISTAATADTIVKRSATAGIASGPLTVAGTMRVDATSGGYMNQFDVTQSLSDYYNHIITGGGAFGGLNLETLGTGLSNTYKMMGDNGPAPGYSALGLSYRGSYFYNRYNASGGPLTGLTDADVQNSTTFSVKPLGVVSTHNGTSGVVRNILDDGSGHLSTTGSISATNGNSIYASAGVIGEFGATSNPKQLLLTYDIGGNQGNIQAVQQGIGYRPLYLNKTGGGLYSQNNTLDDGSGAMTIAGTVQINTTTPVIYNSPATSLYTSYRLSNSEVFQIKYDTSNGIQLYDAYNSTLWLKQPGRVNGAVATRNNTLDDGVGNITTTQLTYSVGSISQSGTTVNGGSTVFTSEMIGGYMTITNYATVKILARASNTSITVDISQTVPGGNGYTVYYGGTVTANNLRIPTDGGSLNFNQTIKNKIVALWDATPYDNSRHDFYGFGVASNIFRYQTATTSTAHRFYAGLTSSTSRTNI